MPIEKFVHDLSAAFDAVEKSFIELMRGLSDADFSDQEIDLLKKELLSEYRKAAVKIDPEAWRLPRLTHEHLPSWAIQKIDEWKARRDANNP